jgi:hypothetical protein
MYLAEALVLVGRVQEALTYLTPQVADQPHQPTAQGLPKPCPPLIDHDLLLFVLGMTLREPLCLILSLVFQLICLSASPTLLRHHHHC